VAAPDVCAPVLVLPLPLYRFALYVAILFFFSFALQAAPEHMAAPDVCAPVPVPYRVHHFGLPMFFSFATLCRLRLSVWLPQMFVRLSLSPLGQQLLQAAFTHAMTTRQMAAARKAVVDSKMTVGS